MRPWRSIAAWWTGFWASPPEVRKERCIGGVLMLTALSAISGLALIMAFIFKEGVPIITKVGLGDFILSSNWYPLEGEFGILPMIAGSIAVTLGAMVIGVVFGLRPTIGRAHGRATWALEVDKEEAARKVLGLPRALDPASPR